MIEKKYLFLRGIRLEVQLESFLTEASNYPRLRTNIERGFPYTKRRQHVTDPIQIQKMELIPERRHEGKLGRNSLLVRANANNEGRIYHPHIRFLNVGFQDEDLPNNVTFVGADGEEYHITPIRLRMINVEVACDCLDFYFRFSVHNKQDKSLYGPPPVPYHSRGLRPPVNPLKVPGVCKHLIKLSDVLRNSNVIKM
jgi:hypothetical protein